MSESTGSNDVSSGELGEVTSKFANYIDSIFEDSTLDAKSQIHQLIDFVTHHNIESLNPFSPHSSVGLVRWPEVEKFFDQDDFTVELAARALEPILKSRIDIYVKRSRAEEKTAYLKDLDEDKQILEREIDDLKMENRNLENITKIATSEALRIGAFFLLLAMAIGASVWAVDTAPNPRTIVSIEYNVGEIIGALLVGVGAAAAGLAYAARTLRRDGDSS